MTGWLFLAGAIALEICGTTCMKLSAGFTRTLPSVLLFAFYAGSFTLFTYALRSIEVGVAYAVWSGVGTAAIAAIGIVFLGESATWAKALWLAVIIVGVVGLRMSGVADSAGDATRPPAPARATE
jgi:small multidrug resistance pump